MRSTPWRVLTGRVRLLVGHTRDEQRLLSSCHGLDVPLVFGNLTAGQPAMLIRDPTAEAAAVSAQMRNAWTAFATNGDPGWPGYDTGSTRLFDVEPSVTAYPEQISRQIWSEYPSVLDLV